MPTYSSVVAGISVLLYLFVQSEILGVLAVGLAILQYGAPLEQLKPAIKDVNHRYIDIFVLVALLCNAAI